MKKINPWLGAGLALLLFALASSMTRLLLPQDAFGRQLLLKPFMIAAALLVGIFIFRQPARQFSPFHAGQRCTSLLLPLLTLGLGMLTTLIMRWFYFDPMPIARQMPGPQLLFVVLLLSPIAEEYYYRGWLQPVIAPGPRFLRISVPVWIAALNFGLMHSTVAVDGSWRTALLIVGSTFLLGLVCGRLREKYGLGWAILAHFLFNVGGMLAAIIYTLVTR